MIETDGFLSKDINEGIRSIRNKFSDVFKLADQINKAAINVFRELNPGEGGDTAWVLPSLFVRLVESYEGVILFLERGMPSQAKLLVRPMLEILFTFVAVSLDRKLMETAIDEAVKARYLQLKALLDLQDRELRTQAKDLDVEKLYLKIKEEYIDRKGQRKSLSTKDWAEKAGLLDLYKTYYIAYCDATHSNLSTLKEDHIEQDPNGDRNLAFGPSATGLYEIFQAASACITLALGVYSRKSKVEMAKLDELHDDMAGLDQKYMGIS